MRYYALVLRTKPIVCVQHIVAFYILWCSWCLVLLGTQGGLWALDSLPGVRGLCPDPLQPALSLAPPCWSTQEMMLKVADAVWLGLNFSGPCISSVKGTRLRLSLMSKTGATWLPGANGAENTSPSSGGDTVCLGSWLTCVVRPDFPLPIFFNIENTHPSSRSASSLEMTCEILGSSPTCPGPPSWKFKCPLVLSPLPPSSLPVLLGVTRGSLNKS